MRAVDIAIGIGWLLFWGYWFASAVGVKHGQTRWGQFVGFRLGVAVVVIALARVNAFRRHVDHDAWTAGIGIILVAAGLGIAVWARRHLGRNWGTPMTEKDNPELITTGPYRWIRNPIYSGLILAMIGTAIAVSLLWLAFAVAAGGYFVYSAFAEQRYMSSRFPDTYPAYRDSTKMLIPFVF